MLVNKAVQLAVLATAVLWSAGTDAAPSAFKVCGRKLGEIMAHVCHAYNSPTWDVPAVVEQPTTAMRRRRQTRGIADDCCLNGCTWEQLSEYCSISAISEEHILENRSVEDKISAAEGKADATPPVVAAEEAPTKNRDADAAALWREVGGARSGGYGRAHRGRRCRCRRRRRSGRRRASLIGNMDLVRNVNRPAPKVGTVSPILEWARTLNTDLPQTDRDRYSYVAVYST